MAFVGIRRRCDKPFVDGVPRPSKVVIIWFHPPQWSNLPRLYSSHVVFSKMLWEITHRYVFQIHICLLRI